MRIERTYTALGLGVNFYPNLARIAGSVNAGLFLSHSLRWSSEGEEDGWFTKTREEIQETLTLSRSEQERARKQLRDAGLLEEKRKGLPARLYFRLTLWEEK